MPARADLTVLIHRHRWWRFLVTLVVVLTATASAQQAIGTLVVTVRGPDSLPLRGAFIRSDRLGGVTNDSGQARITLPARLVSVLVSHPGYRPNTFEITIVPDVTQRYDLALDPMNGHRSDATVHSTRADRTVASEPVAVQIFGREELNLRAISHPTDLTRLFPGRPQLIVQSQGGLVDATAFQLNGVRGPSAGVLVDGLPLLGAQPGAFGLLQLSPLEFDQVEVIGGPATVFATGGSGGGLVNLVARRPERDQVRLGINQSSEKGGDVLFWGSRRQSSTLSASLFADFHQQRLVDSDGDGWGEFPRAIRLSVRPRVYLERPNGDGLMATIGAMSEDRTGGFLFTNTGANLYREERRARRFDAGLVARRSLGNFGTLNFKFSAMSQFIRHAFAEVLERDRRSTIFAELSYHDAIGPVDVVSGIGYLRETLRQRDFAGFDFTHQIPSVFGTVTKALGEDLTATVAGRCDYHNLHGAQCMPRADVLFRPSGPLELRAFAAGGYNPATPLADAAETLGFHAMLPVTTKASRSQSTGIDLQWRRRRIQVAGSVALTRVSLPIRAVPFAGDTAFRLRLINVAEPTRAASAELRVEYHKNPVVIEGFVGLIAATEGVPGAATRRDAELTSRHTFGLSFQWHAPGGAGTTVSLDVRYVGSQPVTDNPFLTTAPGYGLMNGVVSQRSGRARLYLSAENLLDVRLADYHAVFFTAPVAGGRRTPTPWAPLRGRVISLGGLVDW